MAKKDEKLTKYPYSRLKGLKKFFDLCVEEPDWKPNRIDTALFKTLEMAKGKEGEAVATLRFLKLIDETGLPTANLDELRKDFKGTLASQVKTAYSELFNRIPAKLITQSKLVKFFGGKVETAEYQAKLFVWLCEQAGIDLPNVEKNFHRARFDKEVPEEAAVS
jgi:hypothetical protein